MKTKEIKNQALESLTNNWPRAIAIISIILCMHIIFSFGEAAVYSYLTTVGAVSANENIFSGNIFLIILYTFHIYFCCKKDILHKIKKVQCNKFLRLF